MKYKPTLIYLLSLTALLSFLSCDVNSSESEDLVTDFEKRNYEITIPVNYDESRSYSLLFVFHGANGSGIGMKNSVGFDNYSAWKQVIICYPDAVVENWEEGCMCNKPHRLGIDDVGFIEYLIEKLSDEYSIDRDKIYGAGFSQGGLFAMNLACKLSGKFNSIATVASPMSVPLYNDCAPDNDISIMMIHGTSDNVLPYFGSAEGSFSLVSSPQAAARWASFNGCDSSPERTELVKAGDNSIGVVKNEYLSCSSDKQVVLYEIVNGGHTWFAADEFNATTEIINFFFPE